jgi:hypothetical protein
MAVSRQAIPSQDELRAEADRLYEEFGKPLEAEYWGKFVAISPAGRFLLGDDAHDVSVKAAETFGPGNFVFKVGPRAVSRFRGRLRPA